MIVVTAFVVVGVYWNRQNLAIRIRSVFVRTPPKAAQSEPPSKRRPSGFVAQDAEWALSALPECFTQTERASGPLRYVMGELELNAVMVRPPATLQYADCTLRIQGKTVYVDRGSDHLRIPPPTRVYTSRSGRLYLLHGANDGYELRVYRTNAAPTGSS